jgi:hypothetical protein
MKIQGKNVLRRCINSGLDLLKAILPQKAMGNTTVDKSQLKPKVHRGTLTYNMIKKIKYCVL